MIRNLNNYFYQNGKINRKLTYILKSRIVVRNTIISGDEFNKIEFIEM